MEKESLPGDGQLFARDLPGDGEFLNSLKNSLEFDYLLALLEYPPRGHVETLTPRTGERRRASAIFRS